MLFGAATGGLEVRQGEGGETRLSGRFPYGREAVLSDGGRTGRARKEVIAPGAFAERIGRAAEDIHLLAGHDFNRPLASRSAGTLELRDTEGALEIEARIAPEMAGVSWVKDTLASVRAALVPGLSPGFRVAPVERAESIEERDGALVRTVRAAELYELSIVTRPAYPQAQVEARCWQAGETAPDAGLVRSLSRWRA